MKVLFYNHSGQVSGAERMMLMTLAGLDKNQFQVSLICPAEGALTRMAKELCVPVENIRLLRARFTWRPDYLLKYLQSFFQVLIQLRRMIAKADPDLIHANSIRAGLVATTATLGTAVPVVWHLHDMLPRHPLSIVIRWYAALSQRTQLLACSQAVANRFRRALGGWLNVNSKVQVIYNGIELHKFTAEMTASRKLRDELGLNHSQFVIGIVGQVTPRKGQLELIEAFAKASAQLPEAVLLVVGAPLFNNDQEYLLKLQQTARHCGVSERVRFLGARADISVVMQAIDLLAVNSKVEPFGLVIIEAMVCGTPVAATAVDGIPELIEHNVSGWLVPRQDRKLLANALIKLGSNPSLRADLAARAAQEVVPRFSAETYLAKVVKLYQQTYQQPVGAYKRRLTAKDAGWQSSRD